MLFNSLEFFLFFPIVTLLYFNVPYQCRTPLLLVASVIFYMAFVPIYILVLAATILIDYFAGMWIEDATKVNKRRYLWVSIVSTCFVLFVFKYFNFFNDNFTALARSLGWNNPVGVLNIVLPIGLSFHTFQSLSYVIEVYRGRQRAERNFLTYALYVMFYPQLVAGPIERPQNLLHQFYERHDFEYRRVTDGLKLMAWGLFQKVVIADRLAVVVNHVYDDPSQIQGLPLIIATVFFAFQIYCDFSGYSDIALGAAQVMGFKLMRNFDKPYFSRSISEFWKRWHISLSTWFKDYLYISLGGNRVSKSRWYFNLLFTFVISGLWHGANWTYVAWGGLNGLFLIGALATKGFREKIAAAIGLDRYPRLHRSYQVSTTFSLICAAWVLFRARNMGDAKHIFMHFFSGFRGLYSDFVRHGFGFIVSQTVCGYNLGLDTRNFAIAVFLVVFLLVVQSVQGDGSIRLMLRKERAYFRWAFYYALVLSMALSFVYFPVERRPFIYFQF